MDNFAWKMPLIEIRFVSQASTSDPAMQVQLVLHEAGGKRATIQLDDGPFTAEDARRTLLEILHRPGIKQRLVELAN